MLELALELADEESRLLLVALLKDLADADEHSPGDRGHGSRYGEREKQQQLLPKAHGASSSETPARSGAPSAASRRSRTRPLTAKARGRYSRGISVLRLRTSCSTLKTEVRLCRRLESLAPLPASRIPAPAAGCVVSSGSWRRTRSGCCHKPLRPSAR